MKAKSVLFLLTALLVIGAAAPARVFAETGEAAENPEAFQGGRSIYVGDIITLDITGRDVSAEALREKFHDFEVVDITNTPGGVSLSLRTFETGEHVVRLGDKEIVIEVRSTLEDIQREDIFDGDAGVLKPGVSPPWRMLFLVSACCFVLSVHYFLFRRIIKKNTKTQSPHQRFLRRVGALSVEDGNYFVDLTLCFKEYLESLYQCRIIGKTSAEIVAELGGIQALKASLPDIRAWLTECDRLKFTGISVSIEEKQGHCEKLLALVVQLNTQKEGAA